MTNKTDAAFKPLTTQEKSVTKTVKPEKDEGKYIAPVPDNVSLEIPRHPLGKPSHTWIYSDKNNRIMFLDCRFEIPGGGKKFSPLTYREYSSGSCRWFFQGPDGPRPLYNLPGLSNRPDAKVMVCEGGKSADAAQKLFPDYIVVTSMGGAQAPEKTDWSPLAGRHVVIWPDNDPAGKKYAQTVTRLALEAGAVSVSIVQVPEEFPKSWDLADAPPEDITLDDLLRMLGEAKPAVLPSDPLEGLVERAIIDPGEVFKFEVIEALLNLKVENRAAFETLFSKLKETKKVRMGELVKAMREEGGDECVSEPSQVDILLDLADSAILFHAPDGTAYADVNIDDHRENWYIHSQGFRLWLTHRYYEATGKAPNSESLNAALNSLEARARFSGEEQEVFIRTAGSGENIYLDLCRDDWTVVEISSTGWRVIDSPPVRFRRTSGMLPLPIPQSGGSIDNLRKFLNLSKESQFILIVAWLLAALRNIGPYPLMDASGEQGSAKSTFTAFMKKIVDPNIAPLRSLPREIRDLFIAANNGHVLAYDNLSYLPPWMADSLCRLATGGGFATRQLHTDQDEIIFHALRPIILNGIDDVITRADLADRSIVITLQAIPEEERKTEKELMAAFERELPLILGALLDAMVHGLRTLPNVRLEKLPRMADFALWATACEGIAWPAGTFMTAYIENCNAVIDDVLDANPVASAVLSLMDLQTEWTGTAAKLLTELGQEIDEDKRKSKYWPKTPRALSGQLRRAATFLRKVGLDISMERGSDRNRTRTISILRRAEQEWDPSSEPSEQSATSISPDDTDGADANPAPLPGTEAAK